eukprot:jgi/Psemu1/237575/estExt_Genewise1.C_720096
MTLLFGGYDTTSISVTYALYLLAKNPSKRTKCLAEVDSTSAGGGKFSPPSPPGLDELPYTKAVMLESLRLYPPVPATARNIEKPVTIAGDGGGCEAQQGAITLPEGQMVVLPIWSIQRSELNYSRPNDMIPERWAIPPANRDAFCAFAAGARNCVGKKLAIEESVILLACLVHRLSFELVSEDYEVSPSIVAVVQQPDDYLPMKVRGRLLKERTNLEQTRSPL